MHIRPPQTEPVSQHPTVGGSYATVSRDPSPSALLVGGAAWFDCTGCRHASKEYRGRTHLADAQRAANAHAAGCTSLPA